MNPYTSNGYWYKANILVAKSVMAVLETNYSFSEFHSSKGVVYDQKKLAFHLNGGEVQYQT